MVNMRITGRQMLGKIEDSISELKDEERKLDREVVSFENRIDRLMSEREGVYVTLASNYVEDVQQETVSTLADVQTKVRAIFSRKQKRRAELDELISRCSETKEGFKKRLDEAAGKLDKKEEERDRLTAKIDGALKEDSTYASLNKQREKAEQVAGRQRANYDIFMSRHPEKLAQYRRDALFSYLTRRGYGSREYSEWNPLFRLADSVIARKTGYVQQKANYDSLAAMPDLLTTELVSRKLEIERYDSEIRKIRGEYEARHGLPRIIAEGLELEAHKKQIIQNMQKADEDQAQYSREKAEMDSSKDSYQLEAIAELKKYLKGDSIQELKRIARQTPGSDDDGLVARIEEIDSEIRRLKDGAKGAKGGRDDLERKISRIRKVREEFLRKNYDSGRSYFDGSPDDLLTGYVLGNISNSSLWQEMDKNQYFESSYSSPSSSSDSGWSFGGGSSDSGGGFGGGGFDSGGGFDGGGFSSGSGF